MNPLLCNGMYALGHEDGPNTTVFDGWTSCTRERGHDGHHADAERTWESTFHYDGDVCQICGQGGEYVAGVSDRRIKVGTQWVHASCDADLRAEMDYDEAEAERMAALP